MGVCQSQKKITGRKEHGSRTGEGIDNQQAAGRGLPPVDQGRRLLRLAWGMDNAALSGGIHLEG